MAADSYCAICGGALGNPDLEPGSNSDRAKRKRKEIIEHGLRVRAGQTSGQFPYEKSDEDLPRLEHNYYIEHRYDPEVIACRDGTLPSYDSFLGHVRLVMYDPNIQGSSQYFISGQAEVDDFGWGTVNGGGHPDRPNEQFENVMYTVYEDDQTKSFPCHGLCLQIAAKAILGKPDSNLLNPEVLYRVMCDDLHGGVDGEDRCLWELGYGDITTGDQYWQCEAGEEYCIMNPLEFYSLHMQTLVDLESNGKDTRSFGTHNTVTDPFQKLSNELVHHVTNYLEAKDLFSFRQASMIAREATSGNNLWIPRVQKDMAWLWIPHDLFRDPGNFTERKDEPPIDWMKVYLLFDSVTARPFGISGVYMALANRRRIWGCCERIKEDYMSYVARNSRSLTNPNPGRRTWGLDSEIDSLWSDAWDTLESTEQWLSKRRYPETTQT